MIRLPPVQLLPMVTPCFLSAVSACDVVVHPCVVVRNDGPWECQKVYWAEAP